MTDVQFSEETTLASRPVTVVRSSMAGWLVQKGVVKDEKQAEYLLIGIAGAAFVTMIVVLLIGPLRSRPVPLNPLEQAPSANLR